MSQNNTSKTKNYLDDATTVFSLELFYEIVLDKPGQSVVMSGYSVMAPLAQLAFASVGASHDEILKVMGLPNDTVTKDVFLYAKQVLKSRPGVELETANSIYIPEGYELNEEFNSVSKNVFNSDVKQVNFTNNLEAAVKINSWVQNHTNNRVTHLIDSKSLDSNTRAVIVNAIYFKCNWTDSKKFDPSLTKVRDFHVTSNKTVKVPTMFKSSKYWYEEDKEIDSKILKIPYVDEKMYFLIILPNKVDGVTALAHEQVFKKSGKLKKNLQNMIETEVDLYLPKFKFENFLHVKEYLQTLGVTSIFDQNKAKLVNLVKNNGSDLFISNIFQKAVFSVSEEGSEAAAATGVTGMGSSLYPVKKQAFVADHPFFFLIVDGDRTLFNGVYYGEV
ncbi:unnamed protein product [Chilo suppressalis]|uniref:Serpin domain-containing protein n=1 Tax=Chilo suppressalis TaxID=168631 RepID=A0ABN8BGP3_CHISP|nr:unnamed protein product [Chilo suppressalis]